MTKKFGPLFSYCLSFLGFDLRFSGFSKFFGFFISFAYKFLPVIAKFGWKRKESRRNWEQIEDVFGTYFKK